MDISGRQQPGGSNEFIKRGGYRPASLSKIPGPGRIPPADAQDRESVRNPLWDGILAWMSSQGGVFRYGRAGGVGTLSCGAFFTRLWWAYSQRGPSERVRWAQGGRVWNR